MDWAKYTGPQKKCIQHLEGPLFVSAGAGSGKTFTLQQRIVYALSLESGPFLQSVDEILAITFTEKAAAEIRGRVRSALRGEGMFEQALRADNAWISTIHGMCSRILHDNAFEFGLDPSFGILPPNEEDTYRRQAFDMVLAYIAGKNTPELEAFYKKIASQRDTYTFLPETKEIDIDALRNEYGIDNASQSNVWLIVRSLIFETNNAVEGFDAIEKGPKQVLASSIACVLLQAYQELLADLEIATSKKKPAAGLLEMRLDCEQATQALQSFIMKNETSYEKLGSLLQGLTEGNARSKAVKEQVVQLRALRAWAFLSIDGELARPYVDDICTLAKEVKRLYDKLISLEACLDNNGLIRRCYECLQEHPEVAKRYQDSFKLAMIDEFQDTDELQLKLIRLLVHEEYICTVGDAQQSIYRFRGADVRVFNEFGEETKKHPLGLASQLDFNFRSNPEILSFVRCVCGQDSVFGSSFLDLQPKRKEEQKYKGKQRRINLQLAQYKHGTSIEIVRNWQAERIAQRFAQLREDGHEPREMVILLGALTNVDIYANALRRYGFDTIVVGGSSFYSQPEVAVVKALLDVLADIHNTQALFDLIKSNFVNVCNDNILRLSTRITKASNFGKRSLDQAFSINEKHDDAVLRGLKILLYQARERLKYQKPSQVCLQFFRDAGWFDFLEKQGVEGSLQGANILKALRIIEDLEKRNSNRIASVAEAFSAMYTDESQREPQGVLSVENQNAVSIMTIHKSKGLEFPLVAVSEFETTKGMFSSASTISRFVSSEGSARIGFALLTANKNNAFRYDSKGRAKGCDYEVLPDGLPATTASFAYFLSESEDYNESKEGLRKLYVALTRASEYLLVSGASKITNDGPRYEPLYDEIRSAVLRDMPFPEEDCEYSYEGMSPASFSTEFVKKDWIAESLQSNTEESSCDNNTEECLIEDEENSNEEVCSEEVPSEEEFLEQTQALALEISEGWEKVSLNTEDKEATHPWESAQETIFSEAAKELYPLDTINKLVSYSKMHEAEQLNLEDFVQVDENCFEEQGITSCNPVDFGSAFHRVAEYSIAMRSVQNNIVKPKDDRIHSFAQQYNLPPSGVDRLQEALDAWFNSPIAEEVRGYTTVFAEHPFVISLDNIFTDACISSDEIPCLEGEIDLFAYNSKEKAWVLDYKTGGSSIEPYSFLLKKHELQGQCYAYAVLLQGFKEVKVSFVRVEQTDSNGNPEVVEYNYTQDDISELKENIKCAYENFLKI